MGVGRSAPGVAGCRPGFRRRRARRSSTRAAAGGRGRGGRGPDGRASPAPRDLFGRARLRGEKRGRGTRRVGLRGRARGRRGRRHPPAPTRAGSPTSRFRDPPLRARSCVQTRPRCGGPALRGRLAAAAPRWRRADPPPDREARRRVCARHRPSLRVRAWWLRRGFSCAASAAPATGRWPLRGGRWRPGLRGGNAGRGRPAERRPRADPSRGPCARRAASACASWQTSGAGRIRCARPVGAFPAPRGGFRRSASSGAGPGAPER